MNRKTAAAVQTDVLVVGGGNAALCAALAAAGRGARALVLEAAPKEEAGGNSWFTDGAFRFAFENFSQLQSLLGLSARDAAGLDIPAYPRAAYLEDLKRAAGDGGDEKLLRLLAANSPDAMRWLRDSGVKLELIRDNQSHQSGGGRRVFFGNLVARAVGRGVGLTRTLRRLCKKAGAQIIYNCRAEELLMEKKACAGVIAICNGRPRQLHAAATVLACGGFEADAAMRADYLGKRWRNAIVRGTRHNTGGGIKMALAVGAAPAGFWGGCHAVGTDFNAAAAGDFSLPGDIWKKHSYPYGILVNKRGVRFLDEGADFRNYTYAAAGRSILKQPDGVAYQIFDGKTAPLLRSEYLHERAARLEATTPRQLAAKMDIDRPRFLETLARFNRAAQAGDFNPAVKDGKRTKGLTINKSNWAMPLDTPPYLAFPVVCGITFTYGGLRVDGRARVMKNGGGAIGGLFAAGEMVGGLFGDNYPGGSGLTSGTVFGRLAGESAAARAVSFN